MAAQVEIEDQSSVTELDNGEIFDPLSDDADSSSGSTILLGQGNQEHDVIKACFLSGLGAAFAGDTTVASVRKNSTEGIATRARYVAFRIFTEAMARKNGGDPNVKYGWYAGSREEIEGIVSYGFSSREIDDGSHGIGIHLVASKCSLFAAVGAEPDGEGVRHLILCRVLLGKPEQIASGSKQSHPSSSEFDSGVDDLQNPSKYVVWSSNMNSYILPSYILSFRSPRLRVIGRGGPPPSSPWKRKIQRYQLVRMMRQVAGDDLLAQIIRNHRDRV
ncbi:probable inactive poly [ADP-ribose] polymerase SRO2 isoform X2 [Brassica napus]|uniref:probable inactive poly [ADP-ribose] polymerase SRO2 isoform X2 n=1 Tax=Brassica napus TaxID=3708 RepID=UPI000BBEDA87|nr:probable inactive poly [ADP-ribose] polymerase SRO2 isoform X2 [Brassica napus]